MLYSNLLLSAGGGIISNRQQAEQVENTANILIGLGGTGVECIRSIKTQVYEKLKPDCEEQGVPAYKHIRFLGIDSDMKSFESERSEQDTMLLKPKLLPLNKEETFPIANSYIMNLQDEFSWLSHAHRHTSIRDKNYNTNEMRQMCHMLMMFKSSEFMERLENEVRESMEQLCRPQVYIHIFSSLSGATGSGCFLEVCYMIRKIVPEASVIGYFFLPDVHLSMINDPYVRTRIETNAYGAMQELDYCMQLSKNGGFFQQKYRDNQVIKWELPPVDMCYLIGANDLENAVKVNGYQNAINTVTEYVMAAALTKSEDYPIICRELSDLSHKISIVDNEKVIGACTRYCSIGVSCVNLPLREINIYLVSGLFDKFSNIRNNVPTRSDVEKLAMDSLAKGASNIGEVYGCLIREICEGSVTDYTPYAQDKKTVLTYGDEKLLKHYEDQASRKKNNIEQNTKNMMAESCEKSLLGRIRRELNLILKDVNKGPIYAYRMLETAREYNLLYIINALIQENKQRQIYEEYSEKYEAYQVARCDFLEKKRRSIIDSNEKRFQEYLFRVEEFENHKVLLYTYEKLETVLITLREQIILVSDTYYRRLSRIMMNLIDTFQENSKIFKNEFALKNITDFCMPMTTIKELKLSLDAEIAKISVPKMMHAFMELFVTHEEDWITEDEVKISKLLTTFFVKKAFSNFANRNVTSFLRDQGQKVGLLTDTQLAMRICDVLKDLGKQANPLICFNASIWHETETAKTSYLCFPKESLPIQLAAEIMQRERIGYIEPSTITDGIYDIRTVCGFPLSSYYACEELEKRFFSSIEKYRYEGKANTGVDFTDWNNLPAITPQSLIQKDEIPNELLWLLEKALNLYERARTAGLFNGEGIICAPKKEELGKINMLFDEGDELALSLKESELDKADEMLQKIREVSLELYPTKMWIPQDGYHYTEEMRISIQKDYFVYSPVYQMKVEEILEQISKIENKRKNVEKLLVDAVNRISNLNGITV